VQPGDVVVLRSDGPIVNALRLIRRNEVCPVCTSGKKFKHCCFAPKPVGEEGALARGTRRTLERKKLS